MMDPIGLYIHIPYCRALCHYCDFAKTAHFNASHITDFFSQLKLHTEGWLELARQMGWLFRDDERGASSGLKSIFFGGGTPSLFTWEYAALMELVRPWLSSGAEVTLEANPDDITLENLQIWRQLGFNRLSLGVQTFKDRGLSTMRRIHRGERAREAIIQAREIFPRLNIDLIYGWPTQTRQDFVQDLEMALALGVPHLSLYSLTFESQTPLGRAAIRGKIKPHSEDDVAGFYDDARHLLGDHGFVHEEVSNWSKPGETCHHNWLYWDGGFFVGVGPGAHGYLPTPEPRGTRYAYPRSDRRFLKSRLGSLSELEGICRPSDALESDRTTTLTPPDRVGLIGADLRPLESWIAATGVLEDEGRTGHTWVTEYVGASLRTHKGTSLTQIERMLDRSFSPTWALEEALSQGLARIREEEGGGDRRLIFTPAEWFREVAWGVELLESFS